MESGFFIPSTGRSPAPLSSTPLNEIGQGQQPASNKIFGVLLKDEMESAYDQPISAPPQFDVQTESALWTETDSQGTGVALLQAQDLPTEVYPTAVNAEVLTCGTEECTHTVDSMAASDDHTVKAESLPGESAKSWPIDGPIDSLPQPANDLVHVGETPAGSEGPRSVKELPIRNERHASVDAVPRPLEQPLGGVVPLKTPSPGFVSSDQGPSSGMENQGAKIVLSAPPVTGSAQDLGRLLAGIHATAIVQTQGVQGASSLSQSILISAIGESGWEEQDSSGVDTQGTGEGAFLSFGETGDQESTARGNQSPFFSNQLTSARQAPSTTQGGGVFGGTPATDHLKMTQALLMADLSTATMSTSGKAQTVHVELPSHDSGPLSVRISMTDQTVNTQFTTDRNDLGALLMGRQDQLHQSLIKTGLELGQFQVHIDQRGHQEALLDRQSRRNDDASGQQSSQDRDQQAQDRERPNHRPSRGLSLFA